MAMAARKGSYLLCCSGRELGLPAMAVAPQRPHHQRASTALSADLMVALVLKSGLAEYFQLVESTDHALHVRDEA